MASLTADPNTNPTTRSEDRCRSVTTSVRFPPITDSQGVKNTEKKKKRKRKKSSFNDIMSGLMTPKKSVEEERAEHRARISKSLGGGGFQKIEKL